MVRGPLLIDAHVHIYDLFDRTNFLDNALANFRAASSKLDLSSEIAGCLMLTEKSRHHFFRRFRQEADGTAKAPDGPWTFRRTEEPDSLIACRDGQSELLLIAGRQVKTRESLEVLVLCHDAEYPDGLPLSEALDLVLQSPVIVVLPWGFGKWLSRRGRLVAEAIDRDDPSRLFLGDNSARPRFFVTPPLFRAAQARRMFILPGTDPLPFEAEQERPGRFGFILDANIDSNQPAKSIREHLSALTAQPRTYGDLETLGRFVRNQVMMQIRKHI